MEGGALIGQGRYGCVFDRPLRCKQHVKVKGGVAKITMGQDATNEIEASLILSTIPKYKDYFVVGNPKSICNPLPLSKQTDKKGLNECDLINELPNKEITDDLIQYTMPYAGLSIHQRFPFKNDGEAFTNFTRHILEAGALMVLNSFVHYDIYESNIVIDNDVPRLIDFGMSFSSNMISETLIHGDDIGHDSIWKQYKPSHNTEPPEVTCITGIRKGDRTFQNCVLEIFNEKRGLQHAEIVLGLSKKRQLREFIKFFNSSTAVHERNWVKFFKLYWFAFDAWAIGIVLLHAYIRVSSNNISIKGVLRGLLLSDPRSRLDSLEALALFDPDNYIVNSPSGKKRLRERENSRAIVNRQLLGTVADS